MLPRTSLHRASALIVFGLVALAFPGSSPGAVRPPPVEIVEAREPDANCGAAASIVRWTPERGPVARFISTTFQSTSGDGVLIALGYTDDAFWTAEAHEPNDACDDCTQYELVATSLKTGKRVAHTLLTDKDRERLRGDGPDAIHAQILGRLFQLANNGWPVADLRQDYSLRLPKRNVDGLVESYAGWMAEVSRPKAWRLLYDLPTGNIMCWCHYEWRAGKATTR